VQHEAADEGRIAGYNAVRERPTAFKRKTPMVITFCDPNIVQIGKPLSELDSSSIAIGTFDVARNGRARIMGKDKGLLRVYADKTDGRLLGAAMIAPHAEHLGHLLAWSLQQQLTVFDLLKMPFYHPVVEEALQSTLYDLAKQINRKEGGLLENDFL
jgi:dihydrolipoamide dehydrogenase